MRLTACESNRRLLVVDDNPATLYATSRLLRAAGFEVVEATSGEEALELVADGIDLVVLDVNLPGIDGFEVCRRIRAREDIGVLPVVHLSASFVDEDSRESGYDAGADGYLTHPVEPMVLVGTINSFLRTRRAEAERRTMENEREQLLERERLARRDAEHANELKDQFLAMLSHELRNPLNAIVGWAQVLRSRHQDPGVQKGLGIILNAAHAQAQLISDLLEVSRIAAGKLVLHTAVVDVRQVVSAAMEAVEAEARGKEIATAFAVPADAMLVEGDAVRLQQVIWNLLSNSVKFTPAGGRVEVDVRRSDGTVQIVVADTGAGMSAEFLPYVFERFRQQDESTRKRHGGLGLGLSIVRLLAEAHGGTVRAESAGESLGATFTVTLPLNAGPSVEAVPTPAPAGRKRQLRGARVMVVEDDSGSRELLAALFGDAGAVVEGFASADEAIQRLAAFDPELLVSDLGMPDRDGYDLLRSVRAAGYPARRLPAIALTAFVGVGDRSSTLEAGFQSHLSKPVDAAELLDTASQLLGSHVSA